MRRLLLAVLVGLFALPAMAGPVLDGTLDPIYGNPVAVQTVQTNFGDNASELNAAYAYASTSTLYLMITGNLENNFNKLNIFIDSVAGGQNQIGPATDEGGVNPNNDNWAENYSGFGPSSNNNGPGFTFDTGFAADYLLINRRGSGSYDLDFNSVGNTSVVEVSGNIFSGSDFGSNASVGASGIGVAYNGSNAAGITGGTGAADPVAAAAVTTGLEFAIPLSAIGASYGDTILISAHVNGSNHDYLSNQSLGGFTPPQDNLGNDGTGAFNGNGDVAAINLNQFAGNQYFAVVAVPEPSSIALVLASVAGLAYLRRR